MARVRGAGNASTELRLIAVFRAHHITGWRRSATLRLNTDKVKFQVRPDFVFPADRLAVFVDGCFWHGYALAAVQPFDLFPQTRHLECVIILQKV